MSAKPVQAVFFWRYSATVYRAIYGRVDTRLYTKDYLQSAVPQREVLDRILGRTGDDVRPPVEYRWPGGRAEGEFRRASDSRGQLSWRPSNNAPAPWKLGDPAAAPEIAIPGNPHLRTPEEAEREHERLHDSGIEPWILAIKLAGEGNVLHVRTVLRNPPAGLERWAFDHLPEAIRDKIDELPSNHDSGFWTASGHHGLRCPELVERILKVLQTEPNVLLVGPPGTGKSVILEDLRALYEGRVASVYFDPAKWGDGWELQSAPSFAGKVASVVFHPSYGYEEFVAGLVPASGEGGMTLLARPGPLLSLAHWASEPNRTALITIDEFNRGAAAAIFGDTIALLDAEKRSRLGTDGAKIQRPHASDPMQVEEAYARVDGARDLPADLQLPASLHIVAAQNSTDRSVAPLDAALRRRFAIINIPPDPVALAQHFRIAEAASTPFAPSVADPAQWTTEDILRLAVQILVKLNERIGLVLGEDFQLGHALLWSVHGETPDAMARSLAHAVQHRILSTLRLTFADQDESLAAILQVGPPPSGAAAAPADKVARWRAVPADLVNVATPRLESIDLAALAESDSPKALKLLSSLL